MVEKGPAHTHTGRSGQSSCKQKHHKTHSPVPFEATSSNVRSWGGAWTFLLSLIGIKSLSQALNWLPFRLWKDPISYNHKVLDLEGSQNSNGSQTW